MASSTRHSNAQTDLLAQLGWKTTAKLRTEKRQKTIPHDLYEVIQKQIWGISSRLDRLETTSEKNKQKLATLEKKFSNIESVNPHIVTKINKINLKKLNQLIKEFESTYHELEFRLAKSLELETYLQKLENELRSSNEYIYLKRSIIVVRDVLRNNYIEKLSKEQISTLIDVIKNIAEINTSIDKNQYRAYIKRLLQLNLSILPTTSKVLKYASDVFGE